MPNPGPASTVSPEYLLQANSSDGYQIGSLSTTPVGFYGVTPVAQRSNANQLTVSSNATAGVLIAMQTLNLSPAGVGINTTLSMAITMTGSPVVSTDFLVVNKPTAQAGLGIGNVRPHGTTGSTVIVQFFNNTAATITPTAAESYSFANFRNIANAITLTPASVAPNSTAEQQFNVTGLSPGELVFLNKASEQVGLGLAGCRVVSNNVLGITYMNNSSAAITPTASEAYNYFATSGLAANSNVIVYGVNVGTSIGVLNTATTNTWMTVETALTVSSVLATDIYIGASKPTFQAQMGIVNGRITAANVVNLTMATGSVTGVTPTASEVYAISLWRQFVNPPLSVLTVTIAPTAVGPNTTAEQSFTVTPAQAQSIVWVNKPTFTSNIGIVGCRMTSTAAGSVSITFANAATNATITPPTEAYIFGIIGPSAQGGSHCMYSVANGLNSTNAQANELRLAMANVGLITGGTP